MPTVAGPRAASELELIERARSLAPIVRESANAAERDRRLPQSVAKAMAEAGLYRVAAPAAIGGLETHPFTQIGVIEEISAVDGSTGWNLMIGIEVMGFLGAALEPAVARELYADPLLIGAGALNPLGRGVRVDGGYRVTGRWPFASGCHNAQFFWGQFVVHADGEPQRETNGLPMLREAVMPASGFEILDTWHVSGLRGSGSHDVEVDELFVPDSMITQTFGRAPRAEGVLFRMPPFSRLAYNKVGVATGIARAAIRHFVELATTKKPRGSAKPLAERTDAQLAVAEAETELRSARAWVLESVGEMWDAVANEQEVTREDRALVLLACSNAVQASIRAVEAVHRAAGVSANFTASPLERCLRDVHVVQGHITVSPQWTQGAGRVLLGLDSGAILL